jgi:hypothetical protein
VLDQARQGVTDPAAAAKNCTFDAPSPGVVLLYQNNNFRHHRENRDLAYLLDPLGKRR